MVQQQVLKDCGSDLFKTTGPENLFAGVLVSDVKPVGHQLLALSLLDFGSSDVQAKVF